ncbi:DUF1064 domain-containing protein [Lacticaseibacillus rhamnosus]|uniref:DUF1064 domain-containing protein n=1 Tax=Lacticaseibacillus rhamnosus TaxID=47715 RepID=UPI00298CAFDA|nr:DUF1064 domain-containing protein [Lacticaseibacillus rhamnosus]
MIIDGYSFDSQKEADFYTRFVKGCPFDFEVHPRFILEELKDIGDARIGQISYTPDVVVYHNHTISHVYDVKNSFGIYGIDAAAKIRFRLFAGIYHIPVEAVVVRKHDFKVIAQGVTVQRKDPLIKKDFNYQWQEATGYGG